jgi:hypothetical protein
MKLGKHRYIAFSLAVGGILLLGLSLLLDEAPQIVRAASGTPGYNDVWGNTSEVLWRHTHLTPVVTSDPLARITASPQDFDRDGYADLAIGVPYENVGSTTDAGNVSVIYGTSGGLTGTADEYWQQNYLDGSDAEPVEYFGRALAVGDFDGDGYFDLAVGVPYEDVGSVGQAGAVNVIYGTDVGGLDVAGNQYWNQNEPNVDGTAEEDDHFGYALAVGNFDGDSYDDLAIGIPDENIDDLVDGGMVYILYGTSDGLSTAQDQIWHQGDAREAGDQYGQALAAGDFDGDGYDDLAVGAPSEDLGSVLNTGAVNIYYGSFNGLAYRANYSFWHQNSMEIEDTADEGDYFGSSLTTGDFNGDGYDDLGVGVPYEDVGSPSVVDTGAVNVLYGSSAGITGTNSDYWHQDAGIGSINEGDDRFGFALTAGDFDGDRYADLAVGVPYEDWDEENCGIVQVLYGTTGGLTATGYQVWRQNYSTVNGVEEVDDQYGYALAAGNFDGDKYVDLAIGIPYESIGSADQAGAVNVIYGSNSGLTVTGDQLWRQGDDGLQGTAETGDRFGFALAAIPIVRHKVYMPLVLKD